MRQQGGQCNWNRRSKEGIEVGEAAKELGIQHKLICHKDANPPGNGQESLQTARCNANREGSHKCEEE